MVGADGSQQSSYAVTWAANMARGMGSEVIAVFAVSPPVYLDLGYSQMAAPVQYDPQWRADMQKDFEQEWVKPLRDSGVRYQTVMRDGRAASVINAVADEADADIVLVGRRGRGGVTELLLGSVSHEIVLHSRRPVLVISSAPKAG